MTQPIPSAVDPTEAGNNGQPNNGDGRAQQHRGLMVREHEATALAPYMPPGYGASYLDAEPTGMSMTQLLHALRRRWLVALITGLLIGVPVAALVWLVAPENYEVMAWLRVTDPPGINPQFRNVQQFESYRRTQAQQIRSTIVLQGAIEKGIMQLPMMAAEREPQTFLEDELIVVTPPESEMIQIKMRGKDAKQLVPIVNAVKDAYLEKVVAKEREDLLKQSYLVETALKAKNSDINRMQSELTRLQRLNNAPDLPAVIARQSLLMQQSSDLTRDISLTQGKINEIDNKLEIIETRKKQGYTPPEHIVDRMIASDEKVTDMERQVTQLEAIIASLMDSSRLKERDPSVKRNQAQLADLKRRLEDRKAQLRAQIVEYLKQTGGSGKEPDDMTDPDLLKVKKASLEKQLNEQKNHLGEITKDLSLLTSDSGDIKDIISKIREAEASRSQLSEQLDNINLRLQMGSRVQDFSPATVPEGTNPLMRISLTIFGGLLGFCVGAGAVLAVEFQARRLNTSGELSTRTGLRVLGTVPNLESLSRAKGINGAAALQGILAESVDSIRTMLLQQSKADAPRVIMVTSAGDREGKTTVASHLAASLARSGKRTLLVDGDLRSPTAHAMFGASLEPGICELLRGEVEFEAAIQPTPVDGLMLVAAGQCDYQAIAALAKNPLQDSLQKAREQFEFIIIDAAPVLTYADTFLMGAHIDAAILSVRRDVSQLHKVYEAREKMESVGIRVLGAVVNGITANSRRPAFALPSQE